MIARYCSSKTFQLKPVFAKSHLAVLNKWKSENGLGEDADAAREPPYVIRSSRNEGLIPVKPKLGDPRHPIAEWATIVTAKGREAIDGNFYTYHEFCRYYGARRCWDGTPRAYQEWRRAYHVMDHGMLNDRRREALHDFCFVSCKQGEISGNIGKC